MCICTRVEAFAQIFVRLGAAGGTFTGLFFSAPMTAIIARTFLQTTRKLFYPKPAKPWTASGYSVGAHLTPASQNITRPRQFHNAAFAATAAAAVTAIAVYARIKRKGKRPGMTPCREVRVFRGLIQGFRRGMRKSLTDTKGNKTSPRTLRGIPKLSSRKIYRIRE